jgi:hypothetical protein
MDSNTKALQARNASVELFCLPSEALFTKHLQKRRELNKNFTRNRKEINKRPLILGL